jgi:hypothetical protein
MLYALGTVPTGLALSLAVDVLLNRKVKGLATSGPIFTCRRRLWRDGARAVHLDLPTPVRPANAFLNYFGLREPAWVESTTWALLP